MPVILREMEDHSVHPMSKSNHASLSGNGYEMKHSGHKVCDRDSSSESDRSHQEASAASESSPNEHTSTQSDNDEDHGKDNQDTMKPVLSLGKEGSAFLAPKLHYSPSFACIPYTADAYYSGVGVSTGYAPHAIVHPQQNDTTNTPGMLPVEPAEEPIYVNAKQYHAILRRRQTRAKLEAQNKMVKNRKSFDYQYSRFFLGLDHIQREVPLATISVGLSYDLNFLLANCSGLVSPSIFVRAIVLLLQLYNLYGKYTLQSCISSQPYLHESRHRHAMKRARGSGGRFLNTKQLQEQNQQYQASSGSLCSKIIGNSIISQSGPTCTPSSGTAGASTGCQDRSCLPSVGFRPTTNFSDQGRGGLKLAVIGMQQRVSTIR
ncbi:Nuclear transcription factor Y subunit A-3 [Zea mays]|uniref:Nuclear transcription factor Y subunit n=1 Tax=Zea mays TaxID=4577 RepID=A0A3L6FQ21_MAIZE|nr:Nuclear transcription factor Y subunit A-3 [Zea mays]